MSLIHYMQGIRKGTEINRLEREAMEDLFLFDAMDGYDKIHNGEHEFRIKRMQNKIAQPRPSNTVRRHWSIASILAVIGIAVAGGYFLWRQFDKPETETVLVEKISIPDANKLPIPDTDTIQSTTPDNSTENETVSVEIVEPEESTVISEPLVGTEAYKEYLKENLIRPTDEECNEVTGFVTLSFRVNKNGYPSNIRVTKQLCPSANAEAIRLITKGPLWTPSEALTTINIYF